MYRFQHGRVVIQAGRLADVAADVLVRPVGRNHRVSDAIDRGLVDVGGPALGEVLNATANLVVGTTAVTPATGLRADELVHIALPQPGDDGGAELEQAYESALRVAFDHGAMSIGLPLLDGGRNDDGPTCVAVVAAFLEAHPSLEQVVICAPDEATLSRVLAASGEYF